MVNYVMDINERPITDNDLKVLDNATLLGALVLAVQAMDSKAKNAVFCTHHDNGDVKARFTLSEYIEAAINNS